MTNSTNSSDTLQTLFHEYIESNFKNSSVTSAIYVPLLPPPLLQIPNVHIGIDSTTFVDIYIELHGEVNIR